jgi:hypothetical protein
MRQPGPIRLIYQGARTAPAAALRQSTTRTIRKMLRLVPKADPQISLHGPQLYVQSGPRILSDRFHKNQRHTVNVDHEIGALDQPHPDLPIRHDQFLRLGRFSPRHRIRQLHLIHMERSKHFADFRPVIDRQNKCAIDPTEYFCHRGELGQHVAQVDNAV